MAGGRAFCIDRVRDAGVQVSMSGIGNAYDNAASERFFKARKREEVYPIHDQTFAEAEANLDRYNGDVLGVDELIRCFPAAGHGMPCPCMITIPNSMINFSNSITTQGGCIPASDNGGPSCSRRITFDENGRATLSQVSSEG